MASIQELRAEYAALMHAMQSGVKAEHEMGSDDGSPKHLRVGVNSALVDNGSLAYLLVKKGVITEQELWEQLVDGMRAEVTKYRKKLAEKLDVPFDQITLR